jgi:hypothetical protein
MFGRSSAARSGCAVDSICRLRGTENRLV